MRNEFSKAVKDKLFSRVGGFCSLCGCQTRAADSQPDGIISIGEAAHITAAEVNGPRFAPDISDEKRSGIENGIWLCANCHTIVDSDLEKYTVQKLLQIKNNAEERARLNCGVVVGRSEDETKINNSVNNNLNIHVGPNSNDNYASSYEDKELLSSLRSLGRCIGGYQDILNYAYQFWEGNFKNKFDNYDLQNEIDEKYYLYESALKNINDEFEDFKRGMKYHIRAVAYEIDEELYSYLEEYSNAMVFHFQTDGVGLADNYWMMFFTNLAKKYKRICILKGLIDKKMRQEMNKAKKGLE